MKILTACVGLYVLGAVECVGAAPDPLPLNEERIKAIGEMLPAEPVGPGRPIDDREYWKQVAAVSAYQSQIASAEEMLKRPLPDLPDDLYLEYSRTGNRSNYQNRNSARANRLTPLVMAECLENNGRFVPAIEKLILALCEQKSWVLPAHDKKMENFLGNNITIDLASSELAWQLAMADYLLGEKLKPEVSDRLKKETHRRVLQPFEDMLDGKRQKDWWITGTNNWNSVCFAGVTGCALIQVADAERRARYIAAAEHYSTYFLSGFTPDGYCSEGLAYWNYGFGYFAMMAENIRLATAGEVDFFAMPGVGNAAQFGAKMEIINGVYPAFADCPVKTTPNQPLMWLVDKRLGLPGDVGPLEIRNIFRLLGGMAVYRELAKTEDGEPTATVNNGAGSNDDDGPQLRTLFPDGGVYIGRPGSDNAETSFGVALKGGNNAEHHNHNDLGSYVVTVGNVPVLLDPGKEDYTARTFSSRRYESKLLNSYGHPVPVVAGKLQEKGAKAVGKMIKQEFTPERDVLVVDITSAYDVPALKKLHRTFTYVRGEEPSFTVTDEVEFSEPELFETALITDGKFEGVGEAELTVKQDGRSAKIAITATGDFQQSIDTIKENAPVQPDRLGIRLKEAVTSATVSVVVTPGN